MTLWAWIQAGVLVAGLVLGVVDWLRGPSLTRDEEDSVDYRS